MAETIEIEVAYAVPGRQFLRHVTLRSGATLADAIAASGIETELALDVAQLACGVWSKPASRDALLGDGDRVELYRPLQLDPKDARRRRAARARDQR